MNPTTVQMIGTVVFGFAILHTFASPVFERLAQTRPSHAGLYHLLAEVEVVFGLWALVLIVAMLAIDGTTAATRYMDTRNFTEPLFVFAIMVIAGTRPISQPITKIVHFVAHLTRLTGCRGLYVTVLTLVPLLGSFITEPAAMTLAALILRDSLFSKNISTRLKYATLGVLLVNISIGGTLTPFAAPPVLMVAEKWNWTMGYMMATFGWKAIMAVTLNALGASLLFSKELGKIKSDKNDNQKPIPHVLVFIHFLFLLGVVVYSNHTAIFMGLFFFFVGITQAYHSYQDKLILRQGLLVGFFLAGLVVLGGQQQWWLQAFLLSLSRDGVFFGAAILTTFTDNAAVTYLGSLVDGLSDSFKYALVAGAVTGGGLTIMANAPNPAGIGLLRDHFGDKTVHPLGLLCAALPPTLMAGLVFKGFS